MKRLLSLSLLTGLLLGSLSFAQETTWTCPEGFAGQTLSIYNWTTYIAEDTVSNFEALCDVTVTYDTFPTDDDMLARIRQGNPGYDIVVPSSSIAYIMAQEGLLEPLELSNIPNFANLSPELLDAPYDPGNQFTVPYQWGTIGIGYNVNKVGEVSSWQDLFTYDGPVSWLEDVRPMIGIALLLNGYEPTSTNQDEVDVARDFLIENGGNVTYINQDDGQEVLLRGEADMVIEYSGDIFQIIDECECDDYAYVIPEEGTNVWVDTLAIPINAPNKALAEVFIDYVLDPQVGADISNYTAYASPNKAAIEQQLIDEALLSDPGIYPSEETMQGMFFSGNDLEAEQVYNDAWDEIRILLGQ